MQLSKFTDYSFRVLIVLAETEELQTVEKLAQALNTSEHHLKKVVHRLAKKGYIKAMRGRFGGLRLQRPPEQIGLADIFLDMEENLNLVGCFNDAEDCPLLHRGCRFKGLLHKGLESFLTVFAERSLADVIVRP